MFKAVNSTIWATPFKADDPEQTQPSTESGFDTLADVVAMMGDGYVKRTPQMVIYGDDVERIVFSSLIRHVDESGITG